MRFNLFKEIIHIYYIHHNMDELTLLEKFMENKSDNTKKSYRRFHTKLSNILDKPIHATSQTKLIEASESEPNLNTKQALLNMAILVRHQYKLSTLELDAQREKNKISLKEHVKDTNAKLKDSGLPTKKDLFDYLDYLYTEKMWREYILNYLLLHYYVRNEDLNIDIVPFKRNMDKQSNFLWISKDKKIVYRRSNYKTFKTYGTKEATITEPKFVEAVKAFYSTKKPLIPNPDQVGYYVLQSTLGKIGEGTYIKIILDHYKTDLNKIREISQSRGTSLATLTESYNINLE